MFAAAIPAVAAGIGALGSYFGQKSANDTNRDIANSANALSRQMAQEQMQFQERMSNTAYQRASADMQAAGINPILAYAQGGASSPGGASGSVTTGAPQQNTLSSLPGSIPAAISSAINLSKMKGELANINATTRQINQQTDTAATQAALNKALKYKANNDAVLSSNNAKSAEVNRRLAEYTIPAAKVESSIDSGTFGKVFRFINRFTNTIGGVGNSAFSMIKAFK